MQCPHLRQNGVPLLLGPVRLVEQLHKQRHVARVLSLHTKKMLTRSNSNEAAVDLSTSKSASEGFTNRREDIDLFVSCEQVGLR